VKASEIIKELQERIKLYGDYDVIFRDVFDDCDIDTGAVYFDEDAERIVISNDLT
jgi:hypothetical protein